MKEVVGAAQVSVETVGGVDQPGSDVLTHSGQHDTKEPAVAACGARTEQLKVTFLALDRTLSTGATLGVKLPQVTIPRDEGVQAVVVLRIGVDDATVG